MTTQPPDQGPSTWQYPAPVSNGNPNPAPQQPWAPPEPPKKKRTGLKIAGGVVGGILVLGIIGAALDGGSGEPEPSVAPTTQEQTTAPEPLDPADAPDVVGQPLNVAEDILEGYEVSTKDVWDDRSVWDSTNWVVVSQEVVGDTVVLGVEKPGDEDAYGESPETATTDTLPGTFADQSEDELYLLSLPISDREDIYVQVMEESYPTGLPASEILDTGYSTCETITSLGGVPEFMTWLTTNPDLDSDGATYGASAAGAATSTLCPEYYDETVDFLDSMGV